MEEWWHIYLHTIKEINPETQLQLHLGPWTVTFCSAHLSVTGYGCKIWHKSTSCRGFLSGMIVPPCPSQPQPIPTGKHFNALFKDSCLYWASLSLLEALVLFLSAGDFRSPLPVWTHRGYWHNYTFTKFSVKPISESGSAVKRDAEWVTVNTRVDAQQTPLLASL